MRKLVILVTLLITGLFLISCGGAQTTPPPQTETPPLAPTTSEIDAGKLYANNCAVCHGQKREGVSGLGPALTPTTLAKLSDNEIRNIVLKGKSNTAMSGLEGRLGSDEIDALVHLIKRTIP